MGASPRCDAEHGERLVDCGQEAIGGRSRGHPVVDDRPHRGVHRAREHVGREVVLVGTHAARERLGDLAVHSTEWSTAAP